MEFAEFVPRSVRWRAGIRSARRCSDEKARFHSSGWKCGARGAGCCTRSIQCVAADYDDRAVSRGWRSRHSGPDADKVHERESVAFDHRAERAGRGRRTRVRSGGAGYARWSHARLGLDRFRGHGGDAFKPHLQAGKRFYVTSATCPRTRSCWSSIRRFRSRA